MPEKRRPRLHRCNQWTKKLIASFKIHNLRQTFEKLVAAFHKECGSTVNCKRNVFLTRRISSKKPKFFQKFEGYLPNPVTNITETLTELYCINADFIQVKEPETRK
jgi:hypothetical protein